MAHAAYMALHMVTHQHVSWNEQFLGHFHSASIIRMRVFLLSAATLSKSARGS